MNNTGYVLMLESDLQDRELSGRYFVERNIPLEFLTSSNEVITFLNNKLASKSALPRIILLSMRSIPETGLHVLQQIKSDLNFKHIPVVVLGENTQSDLIKRCYEDGANTFINKPFTNELTDIKVKAFLHYWFDVAEFDNKKLQYS
jgi:CheY-like chemotaxis protein